MFFFFLHFMDSVNTKFEKKQSEDGDSVIAWLSVDVKFDLSVVD